MGSRVIETVLIDLDDTLLKNDMEKFIPAYLRLLGDYLSDLAPPERIIQEHLAGTRAMLENNDPTLTLQAVFAARFYPSLGLIERDLADRLDIFYRELFATLKPLTKPVRGARRLVEWAIENGLEVVIATNPVFPLTAIEQRLDWAGLNVGEVPLALVTSCEMSHFCKPNLAYYAEILGRLGRSPAQAAMIGNDPQADLNPASDLGMAVFHVASATSDEYRAGSLEQALLWLKGGPEREDPADGPRPGVVLSRMRANLAALNELVRDLSPTRWRTRPEPAAWSPVEILCHMRDVELEVNGPRYHALLSQSSAFVPAADPDRWAAERGYIGQDGESARLDFCRARLENIQLLESTGSDVWIRPALHALFGPTDLAELASFVADHDLLHLDQLRRALAVRPP